MRSTDVLRDHACLIYRNEGERRDAVAAYIAAGLDLGERCMYVVSETPLVQLVDELESGGVDVARHAAQGSLRVMRAVNTYVRSGAFDADAVIDLLVVATDAAIKDGYVGLRVAGEMGWALSGTDFDRLVDYENRLNPEVFAAGRVTGLCVYDARRFSSRRLALVQAAHPVVLAPLAARDELTKGPASRRALYADGSTGP